MHDPFSMRPFFGYNFGQYLQHWLDTGARLASPPLVFMVNWFRSHVTTRDTCHVSRCATRSLHVVFSCRKGQSGGLLWPGFGDNIRVIEWILGAATVSTQHSVKLYSVVLRINVVPLARSV